MSLGALDIVALGSGPLVARVEGGEEHGGATEDGKGERDVFVVGAHEVTEEVEGFFASFLGHL